MPLTLPDRAWQIVTPRCSSCWIGRTRGKQSTIEFFVYQRGILKQSDHLGPNDLVEQILPHETPIVAHCPPSLRQLSEPMHL